MAKIGVGISRQESKTLERYLGEPFEYVVTVCDDANEACPVFPDMKTACIGPPRTLLKLLARSRSLKLFCRVHDEIRERLEREFSQGRDRT